MQNFCAIFLIQLIYCIFRYLFDDFCRDAANHGAGRNVFGHHGSGGNHRSIANRDSGKDGCIGSNPDVFADVNRSGVQHLPLVGIRDSQIRIIWKKEERLPKAAQLFLEAIKKSAAK